MSSRLGMTGQIWRADYLRRSELPTGPILGQEQERGPGCWAEGLCSWRGYGDLFLLWHKPARLTGHLDLGNTVACIDLGGAQIQVNKCFLSQSSFLCAYKIKIPCNSCIFTPIRCWFNRGHHDTNSRTLLASQGPCYCPAPGGSLLSEDLWAAVKCPLTNVSSPCAQQSRPAVASWCP